MYVMYSLMPGKQPWSEFKSHRLRALLQEGNKAVGDGHLAQGGTLFNRGMHTSAEADKDSSCLEEPLDSHQAHLLPSPHPQHCSHRILLG